MTMKLAPKPRPTQDRHFIAGRRLLAGDAVEVHLGGNRWLEGIYRMTTDGVAELELQLRSGRSGRLQIPAGASLRRCRR